MTSVDKIVATLDDYFKDYKYLQARNLERIIVMARDRVATKYLSMVLHPNTRYGHKSPRNLGVSLFAFGDTFLRKNRTPAVI